MEIVPTPACIPALRFEDIAGWSDLDASPALAALRRQCAAGRRTPAHAAWLDRLCATLPDGSDPETARAFFENRFRPVAMGRDGSGFLTGYYEPELDASPLPDGPFVVPLLGPPDDLVTIEPGNRPSGLPDTFSHARRLPDGSLGEQPDRAAIGAGALAGRARPVAFLADPVDAFFVHVQGSARLRMPDGSVVRVGYAGKTGHPYTAIGRVLVDRGAMRLEDVTADAIRAWLKANPDAAAEVMNANRSYVFFRLKPDADPALGPIAAAGAPLTPLASIAVDRGHVPYGTPILIAGELPIADPDADAPFRTLAIAQDTGSAIVGPARGDLFVGSGDAAGLVAGRIRPRVEMIRLEPIADDTGPSNGSTLRTAGR